MEGQKTNGWNEWSRHVLAELARFSNQLDVVSREIAELKAVVKTQEAYYEISAQEISLMRQENEKMKQFNYKIVGGLILSMFAAQLAIKFVF